MTIQEANKYLQAKDYYSAEHAFKSLLRVNQNDIEAMLGLGKVALAKNSYQRAYDLFVRCVHINANVTGVYLALAQVCSALTQYEKVEQALLSAYRLSPTSVEVLFSLSVYYCESGDFDKSEQLLNKLIEIDKNNVQAFSLLVRMKKITLCDSYDLVINKFINISQTNSLSMNNKILLNYSFAELYHSRKNHIKAIKYYKEANQLQRQLVDFSVKDIIPSLKTLIETFNDSFIKSFCNISPDAAVLTSQINITPIFIVGQPRSGSTLLEQMLIGHKNIVSAGELPYVGDDLIQGVTQMTKEGFPAGCHYLTQDQCVLLASYYLKNLKDISGGGYQFVIDKMPANYQFLGLIKLILPHAKIIHITRDPKDVSWSIYRNNFEALEPHFCSQGEIVEYHHIYQEVMSHWQTVLPETICDIEYETLVKFPKKELTRVLSFCGLSFNEECLNFSQKNRVIKTLSDTQLREGIKVRTEPDWLPYESELKGMFDLLGDKK